MTPDPDNIIIDRSQEQKRMWIDKARIELCGLGYSVVTTQWLHSNFDSATANRAIQLEAAE